MTITIKTDNAAFEDKGVELARILRRLADAMESTNGEYNGKLIDVNGNTVGAVKGK